MVEHCSTGGGADLIATGFTASDGFDRVGIVAGLYIQSMGNWELSVAELRSPVLSNAKNTPVPYCYGDVYEHESFEVVVYHQPRVNLALLLNQPATYARIHPDNTRWAGVGRVVSCDAMPSEESSELSMSTLRIRFDEGAQHILSENA